MKTLSLSILLFIFPLLLTAQKSLSGVWVGNLSNDSAETRNDQSFEMALTEYRGKVYGYSYSTFIIEEKLYYIVKRVKGTITNGLCEVEDDEIVSNNFFEKRDKGVKQTITFRMNPRDSIWYIDGTWKTNQTKKYYSLSGRILLKEEKDRNKSRLLEHLGDLNIENTIADKPATTKPEKNTTSPPAPFRKPETTVAKTAPEKKKEVKTENPASEKKKQDDAIVKNNPAPVVTPPAARLYARANDKTETIYFRSDSLVLALYDNGEVDGDTVSVLLNGKVIIAQQGLKSEAFKKTIHISPEQSDSLTLVLYAENLGAYAPNTGLLIIYDGMDRHLIRFKADLDKNAAIVLRRKKN